MDGQAEIILGNATGRPDLNLTLYIYNGTTEYSKLIRYSWTYANKTIDAPNARNPFEIPQDIVNTTDRTRCMTIDCDPLKWLSINDGDGYFHLSQPTIGTTPAFEIRDIYFGEYLNAFSGLFRTNNDGH